MLIGFIGVGAMGGGVARNLIRADVDVLVYDIDRAAIQKTVTVGKSGREAHQVAELAPADIVFTSLPLPNDLLEVMLENDGLLGLMKSGSTYIDISTIDPLTARTLSNASDQFGVQFLACPLGKTPAHAEQAEEPIFIGGKREVYEDMKEVLSMIGSPLYYMGEVEASCAFKLISNLIGMTNLVVLSEGIRIGEKAGIDPHILLELLDDTGAKSFQMNTRGPWIAEADYASRFALDLALKDVRLGCEMAENWKIDANTMNVALDYFRKASVKGHGAADCCAVYEVIK